MQVTGSVEAFQTGRHDTYPIGSITPALAKNAKDGAPDIPFREREVKTCEKACHPPNAYVSDNLLGAGRTNNSSNPDLVRGQAAGDRAALGQGLGEAAAGASGVAPGAALTLSGFGTPEGVLTLTGSGLLTLHGGATAAVAGTHLLAETGEQSSSGSSSSSDDKKVPNPNGTKGAPDHQQTVKEEAEKIGGQPEVRVKTPGGEKGSRVIDAAKVENGKVTKATQVIRPNKNGTPPSREVRAANDIHKATGVKPTLVPVRPVKPD